MNKPKSHKDRASPKRTTDKVRLLAAEDLLPTAVKPGNSERRLPLQELVIEGLLSFGEETHFEFGQLNILVGPNGSGKSNLIDCMRVLRSAPFDIQETFTDSGFEDWLFRSIDSQAGVAFLQVLSAVPEVPGKIRHQLRLGPPLHSRAALEEVVCSAEVMSGQVDQYFVGSYRSGATLSALAAGKRRKERKLGEGEYRAYASKLSGCRS